jgi:hypothetical protein
VLDLNAQRFAGTEQRFLPREFIERARTHAFRKRLVRERHIRLDGLRQFGEEAHFRFALK